MTDEERIRDLTEQVALLRGAIKQLMAALPETRALLIAKEDAKLVLEATK